MMRTRWTGMNSPMLYLWNKRTTQRRISLAAKALEVMALLIGQMITFKPGEDLTLITGPLHAAPLSERYSFPHSGVGLVLMDKWDGKHSADRKTPDVYAHGRNHVQPSAETPRRSA